MIKHNKTIISVEAQGTKRGADKMLKYEAIGSMLLKIGVGLGITLYGIAEFAEVLLFLLER